MLLFFFNALRAFFFFVVLGPFKMISTSQKKKFNRESLQFFHVPLIKKGVIDRYGENEKAMSVKHTVKLVCVTRKHLSL